MKDKVSFSWTRINSFITCPQFYKLRYIDKLKTKRKSTALAAGSCVARALEEFRKTSCEKEAIKALCKASEEEDNEGILEKSKAKDPKRSIERLCEIVLAYCKNYEDESEKIIEPEVKFELELDTKFQGKQVLFTGIIDGVIDEEGSPAIIEDKTASRLGDSYFKALIDSSQVLWYLWVANKMGLFNIEKRTSPKCLINAIYIHESNLRFERRLTIKMSRTLEKAHENLLMWIKKIEEAHNTNCFPKNMESCHKYYGCEYLLIRDLDKNSRIRQRIIEGTYKKSDLT